jgi:hypothetical protein
MMVLMMFLACNGGDPSSSKRVVDSEPEPDSLPTINDDALGDVIVERFETTSTRQLKRMTVSQARDSMEQISGGIPWGDEGRDSNWDEYADTLGVADYQLRVKSDRTPSVMFQKFLDDAATATCLGWLQTSESSFYSIEDPNSMTREDVRANIVGLRWQIQGKAKDETALIIDDYEKLFFKAHQRTESLDFSWQTVCVAMFTHPDFFMY